MHHLNRILFVALLLLITISLRAEVFMVISNADTGVGTLRESLRKAAENGDAETDYIHFNLPGNTVEDRTIILESELPLVSSNLVLDATSQPGAAFQGTDAKVKISIDTGKFLATYFIAFNWSLTAYNTGAFILTEVKDVSILGFFFTGFTWTDGPYNGGRASAILLHGASNIQIGLPGKGNVMYGNLCGIYAMDVRSWEDNSSVKRCSGIWIQGNKIDVSGFDPALLDDQTRTPYELQSSSIHIYGGIDVRIGGSEAGMGNTWGYFVRLFELDGFEVIKNYIHEDSPVMEIQTARNGMIRENEFNGGYFWISNGDDIGIHGNRNIGKMQLPWFPGSPTPNIQVGTDRDEDMNVFVPNVYGEEGVIDGYAEIRKNRFECSYRPYATLEEVTTIEVKINDETQYSGVATPLADVYVYEDTSDCEFCSPLVLYQKVVADAEGNWGIVGDFTNKRFSANAVRGNGSSEFAQIYLYTYRPYTVYPPTCGQKNGRIEFTGFRHVLQVDWYDETGTHIGQGTTIENIGEGGYKAVLRNGNCSLPVDIEVLETKVTISDVGIDITQPSCNLPFGSVRGLTASSTNSSPVDFKWFNENGEMVSDQLDLEQASPGTYTLRVYISDDCYETYVVTLQEITGPTVDLSALSVTPITCTGPGAVSGISITASANISYEWLDGNNETVGSSADLMRITQPGTYRLVLLGDAACDTVWAATVQVTESGLLHMDESRVTTVPAACNGISLGQITGINVENGNTFEWLSAGGTVVGTSIDLINVSAGKYQLRASNADGCEVYSAWHEVGQQNPITFPAYTITESRPNCGLDNGVLRVNIGEATLKPASLRWTDGSGVTIADVPELTGLAPGNYLLYLTDQNGCETLYRSFTLEAWAELAINTASAVVVDDACGHGTGSISGLRPVGGRAPYLSVWTTDGGEIVAESADAMGLTTGRYWLTITDADGCQVESEAFAIVNRNDRIAPPDAPEVLTHCSPGKISIPYTGSADHHYRLYDTPNGGIALAENTSITPFDVYPTQTTTYYLSAADGTCESQRVPVRVEISNAGIHPPNTFSPNGDGQNDTWKIPGLGGYPSARISILNRYGQLVFTQRAGDPDFDGRHKGNDLPVGAYFYVIDLGVGCDPIRGSLNLLR